MLFVIGIVFLILAICIIIYTTPKGENFVERIIDTGNRYVDKMAISTENNDIDTTGEQRDPPVVIGDKTNIVLEEPKDLGYGTGKNETRCRVILEKILGVKCPTVRPNWLKNPITKRNLELDCFSGCSGKSGRIAIEYDGAQHRKQMRGQTKQDLISQIRRDKFKDQTCKKLGITLIRVPDWLNPAQFEEYIKGKLKYAGKLPKEHDSPSLKALP